MPGGIEEFPELRDTSRSSRAIFRVTGVEAESDLAFAGLHGLVWPIVDSLDKLPGPQREAFAAALGLAPSEARDRFLVSAGVLSLLAAAAEPGPVAVSDRRRTVAGRAVRGCAGVHGAAARR